MPRALDYQERRVATLVDFAGPLSTAEIAFELALSLHRAHEIVMGLANPRVRIIQERNGRWIPTKAWLPDDDRPAA